MPIHRIDLPHSSSSLLQHQKNDSIDSNLSNYNNNNNNCSHSNGSSCGNISSHLNPNIISSPTRYSSISSINLQKKLSHSTNVSLKSNVQSSTSLLSMLSNHTATTEYSPNIIDNECGDLLKIKDLDLSVTENIDNETSNDNNFNNTTLSNILPRKKFTNNDGIHNHHAKVSFDLTGTNSDNESNYSNDSSSTVDFDDLNDNDSNKLSRQITSPDICGSCVYNNNNNNNNNNSLKSFDTNFDYNNATKWNYKEKWIFVLIGLPACGKSTMISDFQNYVKNQVSSKVRVKSYNAGNIRRKYESELKHKFNFNDLKASENLRNSYALEALKNLTNDLINDSNDIGILDATNTTKDRRKSIFNFIKNASDSSNIKINPLLFEIKCTNRALRRYNIEQKSKNKDYIHMDREIAINDFLERIRNYELSYEKVTVQEIKDLKVKYFGIDNVGDSIYYDCGLNHHDNTRHQNLIFKSIALNLLYQFLVNYRTNYASQYLTDVDEFYTGQHYHPIKTTFSKPVSAEEVSNACKRSIPHDKSSSINTNNKNIDNYKLPKVLSSSRIHY